MNDSLLIRQIRPKRPETTAFKIRQIRIVGESFALETDVAVSSVMVAVLNPTDAIFGDVPQVKGKNAQFGLLAQVNPLVVDEGRAGVGLPNQNERKQRHAVGTQTWDTDDESTVYGQGCNGLLVVGG